MNREQHPATLVELGVASTDTLGAVIGNRPETTSFYQLGFDPD